MIFRRRRARQQRAEEAAATDAPEESVDDVDATDEADDAESESDDDAVDESEEESADSTDDEDDESDEDDEEEEDEEDVPRADGPWDVGEDFPELERLDLGAIRVPVVEGFEIQVRMDDEEVVAATVLHGESGLEIMACAAPRTAGLWDELRSEMIKGLKDSGGRVAAVQGTFGRELVAEVPVAGEGGQQGTQHIRFVGVDGPRWFLRGAFSGRAVDEPKQAKPLEEILRNTVVSRGQQAMAPRELIPLELPREAREALGLTATKDEKQQVNRFKSVRRAPGSPG